MPTIARVARFRATCIRAARVTFGFSEAADVRAENVELRRTARAFARSAWISKARMTGRHAVMNLLAAIAVAQVFGIRAERLRDACAPSPSARCAASAWSTTAS